MAKGCLQCGIAIKGKRGDTKYCSSACRQKHYRAKNANPMESYLKRGERVKKAIETKKTLDYQFYCQQCGTLVDTDYLHKNQMYCSPACKQKAYRSKKSKRDKAEKIAQFDKIDSWIKLQNMVDSLTCEFEIVWKRDWILAGCQVLYDGGYRIKNEAGQVAYIQTLDMAVKWVKDYFVKGKPNWAMLRWK